VVDLALSVIDDARKTPPDSVVAVRPQDDVQPPRAPKTRRPVVPRDGG
jgi:hypothetical protein